MLETVILHAKQRLPEPKTSDSEKEQECNPDNFCNCFPLRGLGRVVRLIDSNMESVYSKYVRNIGAYIKGTVQDWGINKTPS